MGTNPKQPYRKRPEIGNRFGRWVVIEAAPSRGRLYYFLCRCDCGTVREVESRSLGKPGHLGCGCIRKEKSTRHGMWNTPEWQAWRGMRQRCNNPSDKGYPDYGGRGIQVCAAWQSFEVFLADMGERPSDEHSIDRINNDGHYEPGNCRWATKSQQGGNRRASHVIEYKGVTQSRTEWARSKGMPEHALRARLNLGWSVEEALETPWTQQRRRQKSEGNVDV